MSCSSCWLLIPVFLAVMGFFSLFDKGSRFRFCGALIRSLATLVLLACLYGALNNLFGELQIARPENIVIMLDRSASMSARPDGKTSRLSRAVNWISSLEGKLGNARVWMIDSATGESVILKSLGQLPLLDIAQPTQTRNAIKASFDTAKKLLEDLPSGEKSEIWFVSDMQDSTSVFSCINSCDFSELPSKTRIRIISVRDEIAWNRSVRVDSSNIEKGVLDLTFTVSSRGQIDQKENTIPLILKIGDTVINETFFLPPDSERSFRKQILLPAYMAAGYGFVKIPDDLYPADDISFFACSGEEHARIIIASESREIFKTLSAIATDHSSNSRTIAGYDLWEPGELDLSNQTLLIWQGLPPNRVQREKIEAFTEQGGTVLFMPSEKQKEAMPLIRGIEWDAPNHYSSGDPYEIGQWDRKRGVLRDGKDGQTLPLEQLKAIRKINFKGDQLRIFASWDDGTPAIASYPAGKGNLIICSTLPLYSWSNLSDGGVLLPVIHRLGSRGARIKAEAFSIPTGSRRIPDGTSRMIMGNTHSVPSSPSIHAGVFHSGNVIFATNSPRMEDELRQEEPVTLNQSESPLTEEYSMESLASYSPCFNFPWWKAIIALIAVWSLFELILYRIRRKSAAQPTGMTSAY